MIGLAKFRILFIICPYAKALRLLNLCMMLCCFGLYTANVHALRADVNKINTVESQQPIKRNAQVLNTMIVSVMRWYQRVIEHDKHQYANNYPDNVQNIQILDAKLDAKPSAKSDPLVGLFTLKAKLTYLENDKLKTQKINERFEFDLNKDLDFIQINRLKTQIIDNDTSLTEFDANYYQQRSFSYAWLALLDDNSSLLLPQKGIENAHYQLEIGNNHYSGSLLKALNKRNLWMGKGEHLLRNISSTIINNNLQLTLTIGWKGVNPNGKWSIAKIEQTLEIEKINDTYQVLSVRERHLMPDIAPWEKLLC